MSELTDNLAVLVGIDHYADPEIRDLDTPIEDVERLGELLAGRCRYTVWLRCDAQATLAGLRTLLTEELPAAVDADSRLLFYFAGHGVASQGADDIDGPQGYLLPHDAGPDSESFLAMEEVHEALEALPCRHLLAILDCCFAGRFRSAAMRDLVPPESTLWEERYRHLLSRPARQVITSAAADERAADLVAGRPIGERGSSGRHSPFCASLLAGLAGEADVFPLPDGDSVVTLSELFAYLQSQLQAVQTPQHWPLPSHGSGEFVFRNPALPLGLPRAEEKVRLDSDTNPYRGLRPFEARHEDLFFGREAVTAELLARIGQDSTPMTAIVGPSGAGKSSLVRAGLLPRLTAADGWLPVGPLTPGERPLEALANALAAAQLELAPDLDTLQSQPQALARTVERQRLRRPDHTLVLVVDQLEELVTLKGREPEVRRFLELLAHALEIRPAACCLVATLRSDFEPQLVHGSPWEADWSARRFPLSPMGREELQRAIEKPAEHSALFFESPQLVDSLIDEARQMPGTLALLSYALSEMYLAYLKSGRQDRQITWKEHEKLGGGVLGALRNQAERVYRELPDEAHQRTLRRLLLRMVSTEGGELARRRALRCELEYQESSDPLLRPRDVDEPAVLWRQIRDPRGPFCALAADWGELEPFPADEAPASSETLDVWLLQKLNRLIRGPALAATSVDDRLLSKSTRRLLGNPGQDPRSLNRSLLEDLLPGLRSENRRMEWVLEILDRLRLIVFGNLRPGAGRAEQPETVEPAHEELVRSWSLMRRWREEEAESLPLLRRLTRDTGDWQTGSAGLWDADSRLDTIQELWRQEPFLLSRQEADFVRRSLDRRRQRRRRRLALSVVAFVFVAAVAAIFFWMFRRAVDQRYLSIARGLTNQVAAEVARGEHERAALLAVQAYRFHQRHGGRSPALIDRALRRAVDPSPAGSSLFQQSGASTGALAVSPDGRQLAVGIGSQIYLWDFDAAGTEPRVLGEADAGQVSDLAFSSDGALLAAIGPELSVGIWRLEPEPSIAYRLERRDPPSSVGFRPGLPELATLVHGEEDSLIRSWDLSGRIARIEAERAVADPTISAIAFSPDGRILAAAALSGKIYRWHPDGPPAQPAVMIADPELGFDSLFFATSGQYLVAGTRDGDALVVRLEHEGARPEAASVAESMIMDLGDSRSQIQSGGALRFSINALNPLALDSTRDSLAAGWADGTIRYHRVSGEADVEPLELRARGHPIQALAVSPDGRYLASSDDSGAIHLWRFGGTPSYRVYSVPRGVSSVDFDSKDGSLLAAATAGGGLTVWDLRTGTERRIEAEDDFFLASAAEFSPGGRYLASSNAYGPELILRDPLSLRQLDAVDLPENPQVSSLAFSHDGNVAALVVSMRIMLVPLTGDQPQPLSIEEHSGYAVAFHPRRLLLAVAGSDPGTVGYALHLWTLAVDRGVIEARLEKSLPVPKWAASVAFSPNGRYLAAGGGDLFEGSVWLWDLERPLAGPHSLRGHSSAVTVLAFSPDGRTLASAGNDADVLLWDPEDRTLPPIVLKGHEGPVGGLSWHPEKPRLASGSGTVRIWTTDLKELVAQACAGTRRNLSADEWNLFIGESTAREETCDRPSLSSFQSPAGTS